MGNGISGMLFPDRLEVPPRRVGVNVYSKQHIRSTASMRARVVATVSNAMMDEGNALSLRCPKKNKIKSKMAKTRNLIPERCKYVSHLSWVVLGCSGDKRSHIKGGPARGRTKTGVEKLVMQRCVVN